MEPFKIIRFWDFPGGPVIKTQTSTAEGTDGFTNSHKHGMAKKLKKFNPGGDFTGHLVLLSHFRT